MRATGATEHLLEQLHAQAVSPMPLIAGGFYPLMRLRTAFNSGKSLFFYPAVNSGLGVLLEDHSGWSRTILLEMTSRTAEAGTKSRDEKLLPQMAQA